MSKISERIAELRRKRGLTQEQLGQLVGVSAQAVSKWEKGGAPDVELLPSLADRLGVRIDALFGRDEGQAQDMPRLMERWITAIPGERRIWEMFRLLCSVFEHLGSDLSSSLLDNILDVRSDCYFREQGPEGEETLWLRSMVMTDEGMALGVFAEKFPLFLLLPEPPEGYGANLKDNEDYRRLFSVLSRPGCLEILRWLDGKKEGLLATTSAVANRTGLPPAEVEEVMKAMMECDLLSRREVEVESGTEEVYRLNDQLVLVPFLYLAQWLMEETEAWL